MRRARLHAHPREHAWRRLDVQRAPRPQRGQGGRGRVKLVRPLAAAALLALLLWLGARPIGRAPALGALLDPAHGVWALARNAELPNEASDVLPTLGSSVEVRYDRRGVPHIFATKDEDAYRALGYVVARDRLFQLWVQTIAASGRLTEI